LVKGCSGAKITQPAIPRWICELEWVVVDIGVAVEGLAVSGFGDDGVSLNKSSYIRVVKSALVEVEAC